MSWNNKFFGTSILGLSLIATMNISCKTNTASNPESELEMLDATNYVHMRDWQAAVMTNSRHQLAAVADALGYGWASGCRGKEPGSDMYIQWGENNDVSSWVGTYDGSESCGAKNQKPTERLKLNYKWGKPAVRGEADVKWDKKKVTRQGLKSLYQIVVGWTDRESLLKFNINRKVIDTVVNRRLDILRYNGSLSVEVSAALFGLGGKSTYQISVGGENQFGKEQTISEEFITSLDQQFPLHPKECIIVTFERFETEYSVPYEAVIELFPSVEMEGFMRIQANGGNFHRFERGKTDRDIIKSTFGVAGEIPFWDALYQDKKNNAHPWMWSEMMSNKDGFNHAQQVDSAFKSLANNFARQNPKNLFKIRGRFDVVKGGKARAIPKIVTINDPACRAAGQRKSDSIN